MKRIWMEILNWKQIKLIGLNWNGQNLEYWIESWPNLKAIICILANKIYSKIHGLYFSLVTSHFCICTTQRPENWELEAVALDMEEPVELDESTWTLVLESTKAGLFCGLCSSEPLLLSKTTTSDIVGLRAADAWVHMRPISMIFFTSSAL